MIKRIFNNNLYELFEEYCKSIFITKDKTNKKQTKLILLLNLLLILETCHSGSV